MIKVIFTIPQNNNNGTLNTPSSSSGSINKNIIDFNNLSLSENENENEKKNVQEAVKKIDFDFKPYDEKLDSNKNNIFEINIDYDNVMKYQYFANLFNTYQCTHYIYTNKKHNNLIIKILKFLESGSANYIKNTFKHMCNNIENLIETNNTSDICGELNILHEFICLLIKYDIVNEYSMLNYDLSHNKKMLNGAESLKVLYNELNENTLFLNNNNLNVNHNNIDDEYEDYNNNIEEFGDYIHGSNIFLQNISFNNSSNSNGYTSIKNYNGILGYSNIVQSCKAIIQSNLTNCLKKTSQNALWVYYICFIHQNIFDEFLTDRCLFYIDKYKTITDVNMTILIQCCPLQIIHNIIKRKTMYINENIICDIATKWYIYNKNKNKAYTVFQNLDIKNLTCAKYKELLNLDDNAVDVIIRQKFTNVTERGLFIAKQDYLIYFEKMPIYKYITENGILLDLFNIEKKQSLKYVYIEMPFIWNGIQKKYIIYNITINYNLIKANTFISFYHISPKTNSIKSIDIHNTTFNELYKNTIFTFNEPMSLDSLRLVIGYNIDSNIDMYLKTMRFVLSSELYS